MVQVQSQEEIRKGPWTEQEDFQLVCFVGLFGDRRWDFIAKVSGLNRTGKSCRLRWVNYLHPGLKRGKMTPHEERLVLELHNKWGNRWSRIARKLPGRTDNEIKNYWRTHMRKKAQEKKRAVNNNNPPPPPPSSSSSTYTSTGNSNKSRYSSSSSSSSTSSASSNITVVESLPFPDSTTGVESFYDTGGRAEDGGSYSMDDIWREICLPEAEDNVILDPIYGGAEGILGDCNVMNDVVAAEEMVVDPFYCSDSLWKMDDDEASKPFVDVNYGGAVFDAHCFGGATEITTLTSGS